MSVRDARFTGASRGSILASRLRGAGRTTSGRVAGFGALGLVAAAVAACSGGASEGTGAANQAATSSGILHSQVTKQSWRPHVGQNHGRWADDRVCHPASLALCPYFDAQFLGVDAGAGCAHVTTPACPDRVATWDNTIVIDFAIALSSDCRFGQWGPPLLSDADTTNYLNDLLAFTLQFFGCPEGTTAPLTFGLIPSALLSHSFTRADLDALSDTYAAAVAQALSDNGSPPLKPAQAKALDAKLNRLAHMVPDQVKSGAFTFSTCAPDSGALAPDKTADDEDVSCH